MPRHAIRPIAILLFVTSALFAQLPELEQFETGGMPSKPTNFTEQKLADLIASHRRGDLLDAARVHQALARYYADKGDTARAEICEQRAKAAEKAAQVGAPALGRSEDMTRRYGEVAMPGHGEVGGMRSGDAPGPSGPLSRPETPRSFSAAGRPSDFSGKFYHLKGGSLETWEFNADGTFYHSWMASGSGTSVRNGEKGTFRVSNGYLVLSVTSSAGGYVTPSVGGRGTVVGGGSDSKSETRRLKMQILGPGKGIVLDGVEYKVKSW